MTFFSFQNGRARDGFLEISWRKKSAARASLDFFGKKLGNRSRPAE